MEFKTWTEIKTKIENDCDLIDEDFIPEAELLSYANEAIDSAEALIHTIYEDYFIVHTTVSLATGIQLYALPSDIYANKIRLFQYNNGNTKHKIERIKRLAEIADVDSNDDYRYILTNDGTNGIRIELHPMSRETSTNAHLYYIRNAKKLSTSTDVCDIPEFVSFIYAFMKLKVAEKEKDPLGIQSAEKQVAAQQKLMVDTLSQMVPDEDNTIQPDYTHYQEFDTQDY